MGQTHNSITDQRTMTGPKYYHITHAKTNSREKSKWTSTVKNLHTTSISKWSHYCGTCSIDWFFIRFTFYNIHMQSIECFIKSNNDNYFSNHGKSTSSPMIHSSQKSVKNTTIFFSTVWGWIYVGYKYRT